MESDVNRVLNAFNVPGIAIAVVKDGKVLAARGFGVRKLGEAAPVDARTLFEIAANSKGFTAATLAILVDEGKLRWDDPVVKHLPDFKMYDHYVTQEMTVRDLLSNRSGLGEAVGDLMWWPASNFSTDEIIHNLRLLRPATSFRSVYTYEYLPYIVAGKLIAVKTGMTWGDAVRQRLLAPLNMTRTTTSLAETGGLENLASPHGKIDGKLAIAKWMKLLLDGGELATPGVDGKARRLFSAAQAREMWTPQTVIRTKEPKLQLAATRADFAASGLGFEMRDYQGRQLVSHRGWQFGYYSVMTMVPSSKLGIAILSFVKTPDLTGGLKHVSNNTFIVRWKERSLNADAYVTFTVQEGRIQRMTMAPVSADTDSSFDFVDLVFRPVTPESRILRK